MQELLEALLRANVLWEKKWVACGDSFTEGDFRESDVEYRFTDGMYEGEQKVYPFFIGRRNRMTVVSETKCGNTITNLPQRPRAFSIEWYRNLPLDADYITLCFGINDDCVHQKSPIGDIGDTENTTFYGAWNVVLKHLITHHPYAKIGIIVPNGCTRPYTDAIRAVARRWGIPYLDIPGDYAVPLLNRVDDKDEICEEARSIRNRQFSVSENNRHPSVKAHEYESTVIEHWMRGL